MSDKVASSFYGNRVYYYLVIYEAYTVNGIENENSNNDSTPTLIVYIGFDGIQGAHNSQCVVTSL